ncbi:hypothetical protein AMAG_10300 [Allomyces macrogynus ATCC 38327]|uniref:RMT2 domain-containing protein n=1 Tax=Allomyces macrogynus (strain ATCC 38327) TaxID=578462 RepID=A0A0L0SU03_ALLM3|nr:hypothetical protein AMAG_10300 [Allomyces macrogynus ATCC 38327]|eukprot:KNE66023.1 hypothetical protein AMAG_10300 [Allomyces macrogynus ATCC 38327]
MASAEEQLLYAALNGDRAEVERLLTDEDADATVSDDEGRTALFFAASNGHDDVVSTLLEHGHPWNLLDVHGKSAADYASTDAVYETIAAEGVRAERLFMALRKMHAAPALEDTNSVYLTQKLVYTPDGDRLMDADGNAVMMGWETPLMRASVDAIVPRAGLRVLNVGFGLGIFDKMVAATHSAEHHVIEAHPDVLAFIAAGPLSKSITVHAGTWRDQIPRLIESGIRFDAIYFDTYAEYYDDLADFHRAAAQLLAPGGRYSWFHGGGASNALFNDVYRRIADADVATLGLDVEWTRMDMAPLGDATWHGVRRNYFSLDHYWLPVAAKPVEVAAAKESARRPAKAE